MRVGGDRSNTVYTVRRSVVKSSLWKQMTTLVVGSSWAGGYWKDGQLWAWGGGDAVQQSAHGGGLTAQ